MTYPLFLLHAALVRWRCPGRRERIFIILPFALLAIACAGVSALVRMTYPTDAYIHDVDLGPGAVALALAKQCSAALPLSAFIADPSGIFDDVRGLSAIARWLGRWDVASVALMAVAGVVARDSEGPVPKSQRGDRGAQRRWHRSAWAWRCCRGP